MASDRVVDQVLREIRETGWDLTMHESLTPDRVLGRLRKAEADGEWIGFCLSCAALQRTAPSNQTPQAASVPNAARLPWRVRRTS